MLSRSLTNPPQPNSSTSKHQTHTPPLLTTLLHPPRPHPLRTAIPISKLTLEVTCHNQRADRSHGISAAGMQPSTSNGVASPVNTSLGVDEKTEGKLRLQGRWQCGVGFAMHVPVARHFWMCNLGWRYNPRTGWSVLIEPAYRRIGRLMTMRMRGERYSKNMCCGESSRENEG